MVVSSPESSWQEGTLVQAIWQLVRRTTAFSLP
jgi:hypothetical protein